MARLPAEAFRRYDETRDEEFYKMPRLVTHIDDRAIAAVAQLYREHFPPGGKILDLMSSWVSHLPEEVGYERVVGLGMNEAELKKNPRLDEYVVQNLNRTPGLPFADAEFDGVGICVSIDYLTDPVAVLREVGRVLKVRSPVVITFSNRCFPTKAVAVWRQLNDQGHVRLVEHYLEEAGNFQNIRGLDRSPRRVFSDPLYAVVGESTGAHANDKREELEDVAKREDTYTHPELRERLKKGIKVSHKGGNPGVWSARMLCAVQAAWAYTKKYEGWGVPEACDWDEGWILDPHLLVGGG